MLLELRADDKCFGIPGGWVDENESPKKAIKREYLEETGLKIKALDIINVIIRRPGEYKRAFTSIHVVYKCKIISGKLRKSSESMSLGYYDYKNIKKWHKDHKKIAKKAME